MRDKSNFTSQSMTITHGTARSVKTPSVIPTGKENIELFWCKALLNKLILPLDIQSIESSIDDSQGKDDVIVLLRNKLKIGIQVTELTYELERARKNIKQKYLQRIFDELKRRNIHSSERVVFNIVFPLNFSKKPKQASPAKVVECISNILTGGIKDERIKFNFGEINYHIIGNKDFYVKNLNNIGVEVNFSNLPRNGNMYYDCVDEFKRKKKSSKSDWLLIWSTDFWRDKHWIGEPLVGYMKQTFENSDFAHVFFIESMDGKGYFETNLSVNCIK